MPSLVQKWQNIQKELDEEENSSSSEEDRGVVNQKRIEEWKINQMSRYKLRPREFTEYISLPIFFPFHVKQNNIFTFCV